MIALEPRRMIVEEGARGIRKRHKRREGGRKGGRERYLDGGV